MLTNFLQLFLQYSGSSELIGIGRIRIRTLFRVQQNVLPHTCTGMLPFTILAPALHCYFKLKISLRKWPKIVLIPIKQKHKYRYLYFCY